MPIYKVTNKLSDQMVAVKANTKAQALNFVTADAFAAEPMKAEEVVGYMEVGNTVKDATAQGAHVEATVTRSADVEAMDEDTTMSDAFDEDETQTEGTL